MPSETFQRADLDSLLSVRIDVAQVPGGASQRQILDAVRTFLGSLTHDDSADGHAIARFGVCAPLLCGRVYGGRGARIRAGQGGARRDP